MPSLEVDSNDPLYSLRHGSGRDAADRVIQIKLQIEGGEPLPSTSEYNALGRLAEQGGMGFDANYGGVSYTYNERTGRLTSCQMRFPTDSVLNGAVDVEYTYSPSGRLDGYHATGSGIVTAHTFNGGGSLTKVENSSTTLGFGIAPLQWTVLDLASWVLK